MSQDVSVSITYGEQKSEETQHSRGNTVEKSAVNAGGKVAIRTEGAGKESSITLAGADVAGKGGTKLSAEGDVNIVAVDENHLERSKNKSSGFNAGVAISYGSSGFAFGVTAGGNVAKGYGNGESQAWVGSQVGSKESHTEIESGGDTHILGSQVQGKKVKLRAENLNIQSLQDTMKYEGKQESASAQVTVDYGASGSASYSKSKMKADMATVNQQAGIFAGDEGYEVDIANHTDLTGGLVTSSQKAEIEGKNRFSTGTLSSKAIANHAEHKGSTISVSGSASANFETPLGEYGKAQSSKTVKDEQGKTQLATGKDSLQVGTNIGIGLDKDSQRSQTISGINTANLTIRDEKAQLAKTGKTAAEIKAEVKTEITTDTAAAHSGKLESRFDKNQLQKELDYQVKATSEFQSITKPAIDEAMASHATSKRKEADDLEKQGKYQQAEQMRAEAKDWETGGKYRQAVDSITNAVGLALGGKPTEGVIAGAASPYINEQIKKATEHHPELNIPAHMIWGAIEAELQGGKATSGAVAAGVGEAGAHYLTQALYGTDNPKTLTEAQKKTIADLSKVAGGVAAGLSSAASGGNSLTIASSVSDGMGIAENAVENNYLYAQKAYRRTELDMLIIQETDLQKRQAYIAEREQLAQEDQQSQQAIEDNCQRFNKGTVGCQELIADANKARQSYLGYPTDRVTRLSELPDNRSYKQLFPNDFSRVKEALKDKDPVTLQKEASSIAAAKVNGTSPEQEYRWVSNGIDLGVLGTFSGWGRTITGLPYKSSEMAIGKQGVNSLPKTKINNPYSPYLENDKHGNEIYYRTLSESDYKRLLIEGRVPATNETFISPLAEYSKKYEGVLVKFTTKPGTSSDLQKIGVTGNYATQKYVYPDMPRAEKGWADNNKVQFKLEGKNAENPINKGFGVVNTGLGKSEGLNKFNENIIKFEKIDKE